MTLRVTGRPQDAGEEGSGEVITWGNKTNQHLGRRRSGCATGSLGLLTQPYCYYDDV